MRLADYVEQSFSNLWRRKLRTFLTTFGVIIGIGALVCMIAYGKGIQKNISESFTQMELFNYISVFTDSVLSRLGMGESLEKKESDRDSEAILDDSVMAKIQRMRGVEVVFADAPVDLDDVARLDDPIRVPEFRPVRQGEPNWAASRSRNPAGAAARPATGRHPSTWSCRA